jgi:putative ATPase
MDLFSEFESVQDKTSGPLAVRMRPTKWKEFLGQDHILSNGKPLRRLIESGSNFSFILWGPPGCGKTTLARLAAKIGKSPFFEISAVNAGVPELRKIIAQSGKIKGSLSGPTVLFIDEIHRFNKAQQDAVLPVVENGTIRLIGATTENPSIEVIPALRSRCQIFRLEYLRRDAMISLINRALKDKDRGLDGGKDAIDENAIGLIVSLANGDGRKALNILEAAFSFLKAGDSKQIDKAIILGIVQKVSVLYDKGGDEHYYHASAFQKSLRGSDPDAAIYWLAKMIAGGEDLKFISRRLIVTAAEDVGLADPQALTIAVSAATAAERLGMPEARIPLAEATIYVAKAPKDNSAIVAIDQALDDIQNKGLSFPVPDRLKDAHYKDAKKYGCGVDYKYPNSFPGNFDEQQYLPDELKNRSYISESEKLSSSDKLEKR